MIYLIGANGNMGRRYACILRYLKHDYIDLDIHNYDALDIVAKEINPTHFIIATPTETHMDIIKEVDKYNVPILCEKPLAKNLKEIKEIEGVKSPLSMVWNYEFVPYKIFKKGDTCYNYYNSGKDGLVWDCVQLISLAQGKITLSNSSPRWKVVINSTNIDRAEIDNSYISMIANFTGRDIYQNKTSLRELHESVYRMNEEYEKQSDKSRYSCSSEDDKHTFTWKSFIENWKKDNAGASS
jgi:hypothetical protein